MKTIKVVALKKAVPDLNEFLSLSSEDAIDATLPKEELFPLVLAAMNLIEEGEKETVSDNIKALFPIVEDLETVQAFLDTLTEKTLVTLAEDVFEIKLSKAQKTKDHAIEEILSMLNFAEDAEEKEIVVYEAPAEGDEVIDAIEQEALAATKEGKSKKGKSGKATKEDKPKKSKSDKATKEDKPRKVTQGVIYHIVQMVENAPAEGISKATILERLCELFPDKAAGAMKSTINVQLPGRIRKERFEITEVTKGMFKKA